MNAAALRITRESLVSAAFALLAGCSDKPPEVEAPSPTTETSPHSVDAEPSAPESEAALPEPEPTAFAKDFQALHEPWLGDLDGLIERRIIRVAVPHSLPLFFYDNGRPRGIIEEHLRKFETELNKDLKRRTLRVFVAAIPMSRERFLPALTNGNVDLVAADLTVTPGRSAQVDFTYPLATGVREVVITGPGTLPLKSVDDLSGREIFVRPTSSYYEHLEQLNRQFAERDFPPIRIQTVSELLESEQLLELVNSGVIPATVMDKYRAEVWSDVLPEITIHENIAISIEGDIAWAIRKDSPLLANAVNKYIRAHGQGTLFGNVVFNRYIRERSWLKAAKSGDNMTDLHGLSGHFQVYGGRYAFDWLMLAAQGYQESQLQQSRRSTAGAIGIMQVRPATAADRNVGIADIHLVENNIHAGTKYMRFLSDRYFESDDIDDVNQWLFSLAAYNAGPARVRRLRAAAGREGHDPDVWFQNVEIITAREVGRETVQYVSNVYRYYIGYRLVWEKSQLDTVTLP